VHAPEREKNLYSAGGERTNGYEVGCGERDKARFFVAEDLCVTHSLCVCIAGDKTRGPNNPTPLVLCARVCV